MDASRTGSTNTSISIPLFLYNDRPHLLSGCFPLPVQTAGRSAPGRRYFTLIDGCHDGHRGKQGKHNEPIDIPRIPEPIVPDSPSFVKLSTSKWDL